ncbi:MAG: glycosyl hydrolase family 28-related protein, partial [Acidobacteriaceae bacterium]
MKHSILLALSLAIIASGLSCNAQPPVQMPAQAPPNSGNSSIALSAQTSPSSGTAGTTKVTVTANSFPAGTLETDDFTVWLTPSCGGSGSTTTVPIGLTANSGMGSYDIQFIVPQHLLTNTYYVTLTGSTEQGASFTSANCAKIAVTGTLPTPVVNVVTQFGADPTGKSDDTAAITHAIAAAQANGGGTVYFPAGTYLVGAGLTPGVGASLPILSGSPITLAGAGMTQSTIVETDKADDLFNTRVDGMVVEDLGFNTATYGAGHCIGAIANNTTLERVNVVDGSRTFSIYFAGPVGASPTNLIYNTGNQVLDSTITDSVNDDSLSFSFQQNGTIRNITHTGSRLALYMDQTVTVTDYQYKPGTQTAFSQNGFYITPPTSGVTIRNFVSSGQGGIIGASSQGRISSNITIIGEQLLQPGYSLFVGDVDGVTLKNGSLIGNGSGAGYLRFNPDSSASNVAVDNLTLQSIIFNPGSSASIASGIAFNNDLYQPFTP